MKVRLGFVSNSSSSSFAFVGIHLPANTSLTLYEKICRAFLKEEDLVTTDKKYCCGKKLTSKFCPDCGTDRDTIPSGYDWKETFFNEVNEGLEEIVFQADDQYYIGTYIGMDIEEGGSLDLVEIQTAFGAAQAHVEKVGLPTNQIRLYYGTEYN